MVGIWIVCQIREAEVIIFSSMDSLVAWCTDRKLFPVELTKERIDTGRLLFSDFTNMSDMVHFNIALAYTDATWHSQSRACPQFHAPLERIDLVIVSHKTITPFLPVVIVVKCDSTLLFAVRGLDPNGGGFAIAFEDLADRAFVFGS